MEIKLLCENYKSSPDLFHAFINDELWNAYVSEERVFIPEIPDFPIYFGKLRNEEKAAGFMSLIRVVEQYILPLDREVYMDERFWHSYICLYKRAYLLKEYPQIQKGDKEFRNIVLKSFDWENYIYKAVLAARYVADYAEKEEKDRYYQLILHNMDIFNYIIKYEIFRNGNFLLNVLDIIEETGLSRILKAKIYDRPDLGKDERYGRRVIFEFNKSYPVILAPMLEKEALKQYFLKYLFYYYHGEAVEEESDEFADFEEALIG